MNKMLCFHNPDEENGWMSNWYLSDFTAGGIRFSSMEQYMMYKKAEVFGDTKHMTAILQTDDVGKIKALGRMVTPYDNIVWNGLRQIVVYEGLLAKYSQNDVLREKLLALDKYYLDIRKFGTTRHAGFGLGFERLVMYLTGVSNIRDVLPYPRTVGSLI